MMQDIKKAREIEKDIDIQKEEKKAQFFRNKKMNDALSVLIIASITIIPVAVFLLFITLTIYFIISNQWDKIENMFYLGIAHITGIMLSFLYKNGILHKD